MIIGQVRINETAELLSFSEQSKWRNSQKLNHAFEKVPIMSKNELVQMAHLVKQAIEQSTYLINKRLNVQAIGVLSASFHHLIELINEKKYKESKMF